MSDPIDPRIENLVRAGARREFGPGFADRVMRRVAEEESGGLVVLPGQFLRLAAGVGFAALALAGYSLFVAQPYEEQSALEAALGFAPATQSEASESVYDLDPLDLLGEVG